MTDSDKTTDKKEPTIGERIDARLKEIDRGIRALEERGKEAQDDALESLRQRREAVKARLTELRGSGSEALGDLKEGAGNAWDDLRQSARDLSAGVSSAVQRFRGKE